MNYVECAKQYIGIKTGSNIHHAIIDYYNNNIRPLPRGYRVKYSDSYCATFVSVIMKMCGGVNPPYECSVQRMFNKAKERGYIISVPKSGDFIVYNWNNDNWYDHVGIIESVSDTNYKVIEGNYNNAVRVRTISKTSKYIAGFFRVPVTESVSISENTSNLDKVVNDVIRGKYGNGQNRKNNLERAGYNYSEIQKLVNAKLRG